MENFIDKSWEMKAKLCAKTKTKVFTCSLGERARASDGKTGKEKDFPQLSFLSSSYSRSSDHGETFEGRKVFRSRVRLFSLFLSSARRRPTRELSRSFSSLTLPLVHVGGKRKLSFKSRMKFYDAAFVFSLLLVVSKARATARKAKKKKKWQGTNRRWTFAASFFYMTSRK